MLRPADWGRDMFGDTEDERDLYVLRIIPFSLDVPAAGGIG